jgi:predicted dehydrogenase
MSSKAFTVTASQARELRRRSEEMDRRGGGVPHELVRGRWLARLGRELRSMIRAYDGSPRGAKKLLEALLVAEEEGVAKVAEMRRELAVRIGKKRAA